MAAFNFVRASFYRDSVTLMRLSRDMEAVAGVTSAAAMMGTPHNRALLEQAGLLAADAGIRAEDPARREARADFRPRRLCRRRGVARAPRRSARDALQRQRAG